MAKNKKNTTDSRYTVELEEVLSYMTGVLLDEFPTDVLTAPYLVLSILDNRNSHANLILDNCLMSNNLDELKEVYVTALNEHMKPQLKSNSMVFDKELTGILSAAISEAEKMNTSSVGTEHVLLALLNKEYGFQETKVFDQFKIEYDFIFSKCKPSSTDIVPSKSTLKPKKLSSLPKPNNYNPIPPKSAVNTKTVSSMASSNSYIKQFTTNLNKMAKNGEIDDVIGRDKEIMEMIKAMSRRKKNNVVLVGDGGCGKTAICYGLANMIERGEVPPIMEGKQIVMLNVMALVGGTHFRGMFEERIKGLFDELSASDKYILFIDDIHTVLKSGSKEKDTDISGVIGNVLTEGNIKIIATTTFKEYRNTIEINQSISRKLQKIVIEPMNIEQTIQVLKQNKKYYEDFHHVKYTEEAIRKSAELADRYINDRKLPDAAIDLIDLAGAKTSLINREPIEIQNTKKRLKQIDVEKDNALNSGNFEAIDALNIEENVLLSDLADYKRDIKNLKYKTIKITEDDIADVVAEVTHIPVTKLSSNEKEKIAHLDETLKQSIIGQDEAIDDVCRIIKRNRVGLSNKSKCMGVILAIGESGCGKTLMAKKIAEQVFGDENALVRIDMSEYSEKSSVAKLLGSSPGYVGFENGGQLTEAIKHHQYCVLLLDEIEKADQEVYNIFLQLFDEGRLTDSAGQVVDFKNVIVIMTSNVGTKRAIEMGIGTGFVHNASNNKKSILEKELKKKFAPEFLNRIDKIIYFNNLTEDNLKNIVKLEINKFNSRLNNIKYNIIYSDDVINYLHKEAIKKKEFGARPIIRLIQDNLEDKITDLMLSHDYKPHYTFSASCVGNQVVVR